MNVLPKIVPQHRGRRRHPIDRHWVRATVLTVALLGLVVAAMGADWGFTLTAVATSAVGFGFFYLLFPGGSHFGVTVANSLVVYACLFEFFRDANFADAPELQAILARGLPVLAFLVACVVQRRRIAATIHARRTHEVTRLPRLGKWVPGIVLIGSLSFALPGMGLDPATQGKVLLGAMAVIGLLVAFAVRDVVLLLIDIAMVFENVAERMDRLVMPVMAFLTYYSLLVVVFACLYRITDMSLGAAQFALHGQMRPISFADALYFSVITIATVGYGDITPNGPLVRGLASVEVVLGLLLLLFGFSEIMRSGNPDLHRRPRLPPDHHHPGPPEHDNPGSP